MDDIYTENREALRTALTAAGITVETVFVPWSKSRHAKPNPRTGDRSLNWRVTISKAGHPAYTTDYSAGIAHCPSFKQGSYMSIDYAERIERETETGRSATIARKPIALDIVDVMAALLRESDALDYPTYEQWASDLGYDTDSRKGEAIYRQCLACGLALRAMLGDAELGRLRVLAREL